MKKKQPKPVFNALTILQLLDQQIKLAKETCNDVRATELEYFKSMVAFYETD